jgi:hypothetical protein
MLKGWCELAHWTGALDSRGWTNGFRVIKSRAHFRCAAVESALDCSQHIGEVAYGSAVSATVWIAALNILLGWTLFGWVIALGWAASGKVRRLQLSTPTRSIRSVPGIDGSRGLR